ncbi:hypothetical protein KEM52_005567 [Ascosphaera acerosa]|nr:hypothetical protein KEM52_005567 [Ascosphaera acerosa]
MRGPLGAAVLTALAAKEAAATFNFGYDDPRAVCDATQSEGFDFQTDSKLLAKRHWMDWDFVGMAHQSCDSFAWAKEWHVSSERSWSCT